MCCAAVYIINQQHITSLTVFNTLPPKSQLGSRS